jgi:hypothetical protein
MVLNLLCLAVQPLFDKQVEILEGLLLMSCLVIAVRYTDCDGILDAWKVMRQS